MARDMAKKAITDRAFEVKTYDRFSVKIRKDSGLLDALEKMSDKAGISKNAYVIAAVCEKLAKDGFVFDNIE